MVMSVIEHRIKKGKEKWLRENFDVNLIYKLVGCSN